MEALERGDSDAALACLREQLTPLGVKPDRLHQLAARLMRGSSGSCNGEDVPPGQQGQQQAARRAQQQQRGARAAVLRRLQAVVPPEVMLPERRLEELVEQALAAQLAACPFLNSLAARPSLLSDYACGTEQVPSCTTQVARWEGGCMGSAALAGCEPSVAAGCRGACGLGSAAGCAMWERFCGCEPAPAGSTRSFRLASLLSGASPQVLLDHSDEVWHLQFSHDGRQLASCGKDQTAILWDVRGGAVAKRAVLRGHSGPIAFLCWSPDDAMLATCGQDALRVWDVASGECLRVLGHHKVRLARRWGAAARPQRS
jgi:hypothetical protein